jgi:chorismate mutase
LLRRPRGLILWNACVAFACVYCVGHLRGPYVLILRDTHIVLPNDALLIIMKGSSMYCRGIRGATTVERNEREEILAATTELLELLISQNDLRAEDVASAIFTMTDDLDAEFPAVAARMLGWSDVALMCMREIPVPGSLPMCIRILLHVNTERSAGEINHVYIHGAVNLRPTFTMQ